MKKTILDLQKQLAPIQKVSTVQQQSLKGGDDFIVEDAVGI